LHVLRGVADAAGCRILLAQKAFSMFDVYPLIARYLDGTASSGLHEARLAHEFFKKCKTRATNFDGQLQPPANVVFSAAYSDAEFKAVLEICSHVIFNSFSQWERAKLAMENGDACLKATRSPEEALCDFAGNRFPADVNFGIRVNPGFSTQGGGIYDPCSPGSRLGVTLEKFRFDEFFRNIQSGVALNGLHFHTLCQQNSDALEATLDEVEKKFGSVFDKISWINFGGGHHITRKDYDVDRLVSLIKNFKKKYPHLTVYLEPGEAVALDAGFLHCTVLDIVQNGGDIAILDASAACHMPDVLEMPYRPRITGAGEAGEKSHTYTLGGPTCLAGDVIGAYSFEKPLRVGDTLIFEDMAIYSMVKNNTFNGMNLPAIAKRDAGGKVQIVRQFGYDDFKNRLS